MIQKQIYLSRGGVCRCADLESDHLHLDLHVTYAEVIIVCFHDTLYQLKYFELISIKGGNKSVF